MRREEHDDKQRPTSLGELRDKIRHRAKQRGLSVDRLAILLGDCTTIAACREVLDRWENE